METKVTICDDSSFAQRQVERALPENWDVQVNFASDGGEALKAVRSGAAEILFLDLTMPGLPGLEVLKQIRHDNLDTMVFVVSADVQPEQIELAQSLGALAFLPKPLKKSELIEKLEEFGLFSPSEKIRDHQSIEVTSYDWMQELFNVSLGKAAERMNANLKNKFTLPIPRVDVVPLRQARQKIINQALSHNHKLLTQGFSGGEIRGECQMIFSEQALEKITQDSDSWKRMSLSEAANQLAGMINGTLIQSFFDQLDRRYSLSQPVFFNPQDAIDLERSDAMIDGSKCLCVDFSYASDKQRIKLQQQIIFTNDSLTKLNEFGDFF